MPFTQEAANEFDTSPVSADALTLGPDASWRRLESARALPENLRRALFAEETSRWIRNLVTQKHRLQREYAQALASILGKVLLGEESAASFPVLVQQRISAPADARQDIVRSTTEKFITPNYFQIAREYEKRQRQQAAGTPLRQGSAGQGRQQAVEKLTTTPAEPVPPAAPSTPPRPIPASAAPPRVVDLRNGAIPSRLPATPPPLTSGGVPAPRRTTDEPPTTPTRPAAPPPPPSKEAPSPDTLLKTLERRAAPPSPPPPPPSAQPSGAGSHGPLPKPPP